MSWLPLFEEPSAGGQPQTFFQTLSVTEVSTATLARATAYLRTLSVVETSIIALSKLSTYMRTLATLATVTVAEVSAVLLNEVTPLFKLSPGYSLRITEQYRVRKKFPKRSKAATLFIHELKEKILETGVVKNTHKPYNPRYNKRYHVSEKQAARIAYSIAKKEGYRVGKYRGPNKK